MIQPTYRFSRQKLEKATSCIHEAPTVYEGLFNAFLHELIWIEPERDMPPNLCSLMQGILDDLQNVWERDSQTKYKHYGRRSGVRTLNHRDADHLAARLTALWELISDYPQERYEPPTASPETLG